MKNDSKCIQQLNKLALQIYRLLLIKNTRFFINMSWIMGKVHKYVTILYISIYFYVVTAH